MRPSSLFGHEEPRQVLASGVIHGHDQIPAHAQRPLMGGAVLMRNHPWQRCAPRHLRCLSRPLRAAPPRPLAACSSASCSCVLQPAYAHTSCENGSRSTLHKESGIDPPTDLVDRCTTMRQLADALVRQPLQPACLLTVHVAAKAALAHSNQPCRFPLGYPSSLPAREGFLESDLPGLL